MQLTEAKQAAQREVQKAEVALRLARKNLKFHQMSASAKRVAIARDVINQIGQGLIEPKHGVGYLTNIHRGTDTPITSCTACALGSMFAACVNKPELKIGLDSVAVLNDQENLQSALEPYFKHSQLELIETAFEQIRTGYLSNSYLEKAVRFGERYDNPADRMIAIMRNIIQNNGTFRP